MLFTFVLRNRLAIESITEADLNAKIYEEYCEIEDKTNKAYSEVSAITPIYKFVFSDRVKEKFQSGKVAVYVMIDLGEIAPTATHQLLCYENEDGKYRIGAYAPINESDAAWAQINENDYYLVGSTILLDESRTPVTP